MVEANRERMYWDWKQQMRMICMARRPDLTLKDTEKKIIYLIDATCPIEINKFMKEDGKIVVLQSDNYPSNCQLSERRGRAINEWFVFFRLMNCSKKKDDRYMLRKIKIGVEWDDHPKGRSTKIALLITWLLKIVNHDFPLWNPKQFWLVCLTFYTEK